MSKHMLPSEYDFVEKEECLTPDSAEISQLRGIRRKGYRQALHDAYLIITIT